MENNLRIQNLQTKLKSNQQFLKYDFTILQKMKKTQFSFFLNHIFVNFKDADEGIILVLIGLLKNKLNQGTIE